MNKEMHYLGSFVLFIIVTNIQVVCNIVLKPAHSENAMLP